MIGENMLPLTLADGELRPGNTHFWGLDTSGPSRVIRVEIHAILSVPHESYQRWKILGTNGHEYPRSTVYATLARALAHAAGNAKMSRERAQKEAIEADQIERGLEALCREHGLVYGAWTPAPPAAEAAA